MIANRFAKIAAVLVIAVINVTLTGQVYACTRGASDTIQNLLSRTQYVVKADIVSVDDARQNGVLHIKSVLFGGAGLEYALFVQTDPVIVTRITEGDPSGNCNFLKDVQAKMAKASKLKSRERYCRFLDTFILRYTHVDTLFSAIKSRSASQLHRPSSNIALTTEQELDTL